MKTVRLGSIRFSTLAAGLLLAGVLVIGRPSLAATAGDALIADGDSGPAASKERKYVCPPCGLPCDETVYDHAGTCPKCGMTLVEQATAAEPARQTKKKVAILVFDGVQIIDFTGPYEVFGAAGFDVYTVAETREPVTTAMGMKVTPKFTFGDAPNADVLVVPGGGVRAARDNPRLLAWVRETTGRAEHTMSVCNGAFILASAGLLDGLTATTTAPLIDKLQSEYPKTKVVYDQRLVDNGKIITAGGLSSGIDGALHVVSQVAGKGTAQQVALGEEYDWRPLHGFARAALADRLIPDIDLDSLGQWEIRSTEGDTERWAIELRGKSDASASQLLERFGRALAATGKWTSVPDDGASSRTRLSSAWKFRDRNGRPWNGNLEIEPVASGTHEFDARLTISSR